MIPYKYTVTLTNGTTQQEYIIFAMCERTAIILAQAKAIKLARGYDLVSIVQDDDKIRCYSY
jgi:hypothetical protein